MHRKGVNMNVHPTKQNIQTIASLEHNALQNRSVAERVSDTMTRAVGSVPSIVFHGVWFIGWVLVNTAMVSGIEPFDPFPFGILTLIVSTEGVLLAIIILISQNRMIRQADRRAHLDLQIGLLSEQELTLVLDKLDRMGRHLGMSEDTKDGEARQLVEETDVSAMAQNLDDRLPKG
jgi:uncharacterized membrane protein